MNEQARNEQAATTPMSFDQLWEAVRSLPRGKQRRLHKMLKIMLAKRGSLTKEDEVDLLLLRDGIITDAPMPSRDAADENWKPIEHTGKPPSEIIIEERR